MVYEYTKPRGPIAAMYSSPGPCYALPGLLGQNRHDPRSLHTKGPAYPFGIRHGKFKDDCSPGPCYRPSPKINHHGPPDNPVYSLYSRPKDSSQFKTPGPGAYSPEKSGPAAQYEHPKYSFGIRHRHRKSDTTPAPNSYTLPPMVGRTTQSSKKQAPCYTLTGRSNYGAFHEDLSKTPGPGSYTTSDPNTTKIKAPHYSMTSRNVMPGDTTEKPGPGAHSPEDVWNHKRMAPKFSFGIHHSPYTAPLIVDVQD